VTHSVTSGPVVGDGCSVVRSGILEHMSTEDWESPD
jgi:hypothetical protein